jgi:predicted DNA-binding transcriptional regulator AlpA
VLKETPWWKPGTRYLWWVAGSDGRLRTAKGRLAPAAEVRGCRALDGGHLLTTEQVAERCGLSIAQVRDRVKDRTIPEPLRVGGSGQRAAALLWPRSVIDEWNRDRTAGGRG